jgi:hypothetical protein
VKARWGTLMLAGRARVSSAWHAPRGAEHALADRLHRVLTAGKTAIVHTVEGGHVLGAGLGDGDTAGRISGRRARRAPRCVPHPGAPFPSDDGYSVLAQTTFRMR